MDRKNAKKLIKKIKKKTTGRIIPANEVVYKVEQTLLGQKASMTWTWQDLHNISK